jgi:outer membrane lipoprotein-sorting protein
LNRIGSEQIPSDIEKIAEREFGKFSGKLEDQRHINFKEYFMKTKLIKISVAADIVLAIILGIPFFKGSGPSVTLAGVYEKMQLVDAFMYKIKMVMTGNMQPGMPSGPIEMTGTVLISNEYGMKMEMEGLKGDSNQKMHQQMYMLPQGKKMYSIMPEQKQYMIMEFDDELLERMKKQSNDPRDLLRQILNCKYETIGKSVIDGVEVEGFQTTDPAVGGGMVEDLKVTLWVDVKTWLPVREEMYYKLNEQMQMEGELYDFQWYVQVSADEFEPVIPQDYTALGGYKLPSFNEDTAIEGLRFFAESMGKYPEKLDMMTMMQGIEAIARQREDINSLPKEVQAQKLMEITRPVQSLMGFYVMLVQDKKEPAYYGNVIGPADTDKVLMRWKVSENEYRVIYGNLTAETVSAEKLAELESKLPK